MTPFYQSAKSLNNDWHTAMGPGTIYFPALNKTILCWTAVGTAGHKSVQVAAYDHSTSTWSERHVVGNYLLADDNHGQPALCQDADGYFYVFYGSHASPLKWSISTNPNDISSWTQQLPLSGPATYPTALLVGSTIYLFHRSEVTSGRAKLAIRTATPSGGNATFSNITNIVDFDVDSRCYHGEMHIVGTDIHFVCSRHNAANTIGKGVYYFIYDTNTGSIRNHDGSFVTVSGNLPVNLTNANTHYRLFDHGTGQGEVPSLCFDSNGDPHIIFADNNGGSATYQLKHIRKSAGLWSPPAVVDTIYDYLAGSAFTTIYSIVPTVSGNVEAWYINNVGDKLRKIRTPAGSCPTCTLPGTFGTWGSQELMQAAGPYKLLSNQSVRNAHPDLRVVFCEGSATELDADAIYNKRYAHGDSGPITAVLDMTPQDPLWNNVQIMMGFESRNGSPGFVNEAESCFSPTVVGNCRADTSLAKFGAASGLFDGNGDYITFPHSPLFSVSNGDFCVEAFVRRTASNKLQTIATKRPTSGSSEWIAYILDTNQLGFQAFNTGTFVLNLAGTTVLTAGVWYHAAFSREGTTWRIFLDGNLEATGTETSAPSTNTAALQIGRLLAVSTRDFGGNMDEFRFTAGNSRYTTNFTPPIAAFPRR